MNFTHYLPTQVISGRNCVFENRELLKSLGSRALIVTGESSAQNGALSDIMSALIANGQSLAIYSSVPQNPTLRCIRTGVATLRQAGADFIIAVGGGSPMDAAKAIALFATQADLRDEDIFAGKFQPYALPMAHIPTTAGTGSEVTQYSILTNDLNKTKTSISSPFLFPRYAFLDGKYMQNLPREIGVSTALDALSHGVESLLSKKSTPVSAALAKESIRLIFPMLRRLIEETLSLEERDRLLYASCIAGMAIAQSGTTALHGMGYKLTYFYNTPHGRANGLLLGETLKLCEKKELLEVNEILSCCGVDDVEAFCNRIDFCLGERENFPASRLNEFAKDAMANKNIAKSKYEPTEEEVRNIYLRSVGDIV